MTELLRGRQRRYFGYKRDITHKVDTPESAKSFRSEMSIPTRTARRKYEPHKTFKPDPGGKAHFADRVIHRAVKTEIPGLLPALGNSTQFDSRGENAIFLRSPDFEQHFERSLHYMWLKRPDRHELCQYFQKHVKTKEKTRFRKQIKQGKLTGAAAETFAIEQQSYLESLITEPKFFRQKRISEVPSRMLRQNRKFQTSYWDPVKFKNVSDPFRRTKGKTPGLDSICQEHWGMSPEYADLMTCVQEYNRRQMRNQELNANNLELSEAKEQARRLSLFGTLEDEERRRGHKHIKQLCEYDAESEELWKQQAKLMISAATYINKIKAGRRFPTPPKEIRKKKKKPDSPTGEPSRAPSSIDVYEYMEKAKTPEQTIGDPLKPFRSRKFPPLPGAPKPEPPVKYDPEEYTKDVHHHHSHHDHHLHRKHKHFHHNYNTEDFYMEMYLHFLNPNEDVTLKSAPTQLTDVKELRKKMHLDEDHEYDKKLIDMCNADSIEALHIHTIRKTIFPHGAPDEESHQHKAMTVADIQHEKEILMDHLERLNNPRLTQMLTKAMSQMSLSLRSSYLTLTSSGGTARPASEDADEDDPTQTVGTEPEEDLDVLGDVPEHELRIIMGEIEETKDSSSSELISSESSQGEEEEEGEGEHEGQVIDEMSLFKKAKKKKDSMAEFMDLTTEFRHTVCKNQEGKTPAQMNPFVEAVCVLYPEAGEKKKKGNKNKEYLEKSLQHLH